MKIGDIVTWGDFTDCFGVYHPEVSGLVVASIQEIPAAYDRPAYQRIMAYGPGLSSYEGATRFFRKA